MGGKVGEVNSNGTGYSEIYWSRMSVAFRKETPEIMQCRSDAEKEFINVDLVL